MLRWWTELRGHFVLGQQRTPLKDVAFPVRQLADYPVLTVRQLELLERIGRAARAAGLDAPEIERQAGLLREGTTGSARTEGDSRMVAATHHHLHGREPETVG